MIAESLLTPVSESQLARHLVHAFRYIIPTPKDRLPHGSQNVGSYLTTLLLLVVMAGLARRQGTWSLRLAILPFAMFFVLRLSFGFVVRDIGEEPTNHSFGEFFNSYESDAV